MRSAPLAVLLVIASSAAGVLASVYLSLIIGKNFGHDMGDVALALFGGVLVGLTLGIGAGIYGVVKCENRGRLIATAVSIAVGAGSYELLVLLFDSIPPR